MSDTVEQITMETIEEETVASTINLKKQADAITNRRTLYAAGAGLLPFPLVDVAALLGVQAFMVKDIADVYGVDFKEQKAKSIITTLVGDLGALGVMSGVKAIPVVGSILGAFSASLTGAAATYALGRVFTQHFDQGGTLLNFDPVTSRKYFQEAYEEGRLYVEDLSETDEEIKEKRGWGNMFKRKKASTDTATEIAELKEKNLELKGMLIQLQESIDALKATKE